MFEIPVEKNRRSMTLVWLMGLLLIGVVMMYFLGKRYENNVATQLDVSSNVPGTDSTKELFIMLDAGLDSVVAEKRIMVAEGERLSITGTIDRPPTPATMAGRYRGLSEIEEKELRRQSVYLHAVGVKEL